MSLVKECLRQYSDTGRQMPVTFGSWVSTFSGMLTALPRVLTIVGRAQELALCQIVESGDFKVEAMDQRSTSEGQH